MSLTLKKAWRDASLVLLLCFIYLFTANQVIGFKSDQLVLVALFSISYLASPTSKKIIIGFSIFIVYWIIFDFMKAFPNYRFSEVHIQSLYEAEKYYFGILDNKQILTPNEYWLSRKNSLMDVASGLFYLCWVPVPLSIAIFFYFRDRKQFLYFALNFFLLNMIGFSFYYLYPAAPPWYVQEHGFTFIQNTLGSEAGLARFDQFFNVSIFKALYAKSSNVFAAMPSLHSAYPLFVLYYGLKYRLGWINVFFITICFGIWFAAVYSSHHYVLDVSAGICTTIISILVFNTLLKYSHTCRRFIDAYAARIL